MVKQLVREFMSEHDELFGWRETVENLDTTAGRRPKGSAQVIDGFDGDPARDDRRAQRLGLAAGIAGRLGRFGKRLAVG